VQMDGIEKETNKTGIAVFTGVTPGTHNFEIEGEDGYMPFKGSISVTGDMTVNIKLVRSPGKVSMSEHEDKE
ncbi:MAG TPA: hypothetical protein VIO11_10335, partial [Candidatus Methanoperedens sp.]